MENDRILWKKNLIKESPTDGVLFSCAWKKAETVMLGHRYGGDYGTTEEEIYRRQEILWDGTGGGGADHVTEWIDECGEPS